MKLAKWPFPSPYFYLFYCDSSIIIEIIAVRNIKERFDSKVDNMTKTAYTIMAWISKNTLGCGGVEYTRALGPCSRLAAPTSFLGGSFLACLPTHVVLS